MRVAMAVVVGAACALSSGGRELPTAPPPRAKPTDADWLPKPGPDISKEVIKDRKRVVSAAAPTAFPDIDLPEILVKPDAGIGELWASFEKRCPRLFGTIGLTIEATDGTLEKLLKARLHQGVLEFQQSPSRPVAVSTGPGRTFRPNRECLLDIQSAVAELWAGRLKEQIPWLEELVIAAKVLERHTRVRVQIGVEQPSELHATSRVRLKLEVELWKAKNAK